MSTNTAQPAREKRDARAEAERALQVARDAVDAARAPLAACAEEVDRLDAEREAVGARIKSAIAAADPDAPVRELSRRRRELDGQYEDASEEQKLLEAVLASAERNALAAAVRVEEIDALEVVDAARELGTQIEAHLQAIADAFDGLEQLRIRRNDMKSRIQRFSNQAANVDDVRGVRIPYITPIERATGLRYNVVSEIASRVKSGAHREHER